jgi:hypothetical protein
MMVLSAKFNARDEEQEALMSPDKASLYCDKILQIGLQDFIPTMGIKDYLSYYILLAAVGPVNNST